MPEAANELDDRLARLRRQLDNLVRDPVRQRTALPFGVADIDAYLPAGGLRSGALHEVSEAGAAAGYGALGVPFAAGILARLPGPVLWCVRNRDFFAPSLVGVGLMPGRIVFTETWSDAEVLPAMEEGLRIRGLAAVVGEVSRLGLTASRRLQLAAERTGVMALAIRRWRTGAEREAGEGEPTVALTRWRVSPQPGTGPPLRGLPRARWLVELTRARGAGAPRSWILEAPDATGRLRLPADLVDRPVAAPERFPRAGVG